MTNPLIVFAIRIVVWCALGYVGGWIAARKGYSPRLGILVGVIVGPLGLLVAALLPRTREGREQAQWEQQLEDEAQESARHKTCPGCGRELSVVTSICPRCEHHFG